MESWLIGLPIPNLNFPKHIIVQIEHVPDQEAVARLEAGVVIRGRTTQRARVRLLSHAPTLWERPVPIRYRKSIPTSWLEITIYEGMNRQVRKMTAAVGHPALRVVRVAVGPIRISSIASGESRPLNPSEKQMLMKAVRLRERTP